MSYEYPNTHTPFNKNFRQAKLNGDVLGFVDDPNTLVREYELEWINEELEYPIDVKEIGKIAKNLFNELSTKYSINVLPMKFVIGKTRGNKDGIYTISKKIQGTDIMKLSAKQVQSIDFESKIGALIGSLVRYLKEKKINQDQYYLDDIVKFSQFLVSKEDGEIYLVDNDPSLMEVAKEEDYKDNVEVLIEEIKEIEEKYGFQFNQYKTELQELIQ
ncbi:MAG: hypothetical protein GF335_04175 [Candidatus Moranbacteria bacterium]|nr:hypothetical protein [Candidatus Moranbacteria bacterium]